MALSEIKSNLKDANLYGMAAAALVGALFAYGLGMTLAARYPGKKWVAYVPALIGFVGGVAFIKSKSAVSYGLAFALGSVAGGGIVAVQTTGLGARMMARVKQG